MISAQNLSLTYGKRTLFQEVNITFSPGNCYGLIGANGAGKSTFLKILSGEIDPTEGSVHAEPGKRIAVLKQDHFAYDDFPVMETVIMGHDRLYALMKERDELYAKADFSEEDGMRAADIESELAELNVWEAESEAAILLSGLGIPENLHQNKVSDLEGGQKVRVLLAQALFGNPDILLLDEPTNHLDIDTIKWLEEFLYKFENTVIVVSHDRHFLNQVCTHMADIDYGKITLYVGNYDFWYHARELRTRQVQDRNRKAEEKAAELKAFIARFSSNASKARQATSRKKLLDKLNFEDLPVSSRKPPYIVFKPERECGKSILTVEGLSKTIDGEKVLDNFDLMISKGDKIAFVGPNEPARTTLFQILIGELEPDAGSFQWGGTIKPTYFPKDNAEYFAGSERMIDWLRQYSPDQEESFVRGFLGRMLFSGEEALKSVNVLSGGEKVRCMLSRMMMLEGNALILDEPTNHLDLESITAVNDALIKFSEIVLFSSHDHEFVQTLANRIIEITPNGVIDRRTSFDEYLADESIRNLRTELYGNNAAIMS
ncbi:MAG: ATP-binding cassette domain-containing protein [Acidobacteriota bacterium]|nr:ATP-binding cassette domain-containing protein [Acidobacteriota bacterium]